MSRPLQNVNYVTVNVDDYEQITTSSPVASSFSQSIKKSRSISQLSLLSSLSLASTSSCSDLIIQTGSSDNYQIRPDDGANTCYRRTKNRLHRRAHIHEDYRSRSNTDPGSKPDKQLRIPILTMPIFKTKRNKGDGRALGSLIEQTVKLTSASVGLRASSNGDLCDQCTPSITGDVRQRFSRSTGSVSTLMQLNSDNLMAPLQSCAEAHSVTDLNTFTKRISTNDCHNSNNRNSAPGQHQLRPKRQLSEQSDYSSAPSTSVNENFQSSNTLGNSIKQQDHRSLRHSNSSGGFLNPLVTVASTGSIRSLSPSRKSISSSISNTAKHEQQSSSAANVAAASLPLEKEKKRKEVSSSRVKKFHRHFSQVSKDEKLINYFSCALVSDILLQGHLYITEQHFAFYSNVFGYVTKVVIPTSSVTKISKEKTVKIIPNAVGVATADERHVFGSFISREAAFRLMCSVCSPLGPAEPIPKTPADIEISEYSIEDDSSCSISGNESPPQINKCADTSSNNMVEECSQPMLRRTVLSSSVTVASSKDNFNDKFRHSDIPVNAKFSSSSSPNHSSALRTSLPAKAHLNNTVGGDSGMTNTPTGATAAAVTNPSMIIGGSASSSTSGSSSPTPSTASLPTTVMAKPKSAARAAAESIKSISRNTLTHFKFSNDLYVVYLGVLLSVVLALFSVFLLYRILDIEAKTQYHSSVDFNWGSASDDDIFAEALRWQRELQAKSSEEAQNILNSNLQQIAKVRRSLETLSMLIHDRSSYAATDRDDRD